MISPWLIYFADTADTIKILFLVTALFFAFLIAAFFITDFTEDDSYHKGNRSLKIKHVLRVPILIFSISACGLLITPSTNTIYKMLIIPPVINSQVIQKLPDELQLFIDKELMLNTTTGAPPND